MKSASKPTSKTARPLTMRLMKLEPCAPRVGGRRSKRVRRHRWVPS